MTDEKPDAEITTSVSPQGPDVEGTELVSTTPAWVDERREAADAPDGDSMKARTSAEFEKLDDAERTRAGLPTLAEEREAIQDAGN